MEDGGWRMERNEKRITSKATRMTKVLLINTNTEKSPYPVPPIGLCMLASVLEDLFNVKVYDGVFDEGISLIALVEDFAPDYIGFSIRNIDDVVADRPLFYVNRIISDFIVPVKKITSVPVILGGSGFSIFPVELMKMTGAEYGIVGEGEDILPELLIRLEKGEEITDLPNVINNKNLLVQKGKPSIFIHSTSLKFTEIDRHINFSPYLHKGVYSVQTKRGCSHGCIYCTYPLIEGKQFRRRNPVSIVDEIEQAHKRLGAITFEFVDSTFNDPKGHAEAICREIITRKLKVRLRTMGINPRNVSEELFELMITAGFTQIDATPDSASPSVLKQFDKGFTLAEIEKMALLIRKYDLPTMWFFLFSGPGETSETFRETLNFIDTYVNPDDLVYMNAGLRVYPGTPLYNIALNEGVIRPGQSVLYPPFFYFSERCGRVEINHLILEAVKSRSNCLPSSETTPSPEMMTEAIALRTELNLMEPMFRTLLRIRKKLKL
jgi:radical SAM superfamily enzyme YgiQ (UPF0313 family)